MMSAPDLLEALPHGWFNHGPRVLDLIEEAQPRVIVELGTWLGASAIAMARSVRRWGGVVHCVDTWTGDLTDEGGTSRADASPLMILSCARAMVDAGIGAYVRLIPATTQAAAAAWRGPIDLLYVDADHSYEGALNDLLMWAPHVRRGGLIVGDDYGHPRYPGVAQAWDAFEDGGRHTFTRYQTDPPHPSGVRLIYGVMP